MTGSRQTVRHESALWKSLQGSQNVITKADRISPSVQRGLVSEINSKSSITSGRCLTKAKSKSALTGQPAACLSPRCCFCADGCLHLGVCTRDLKLRRGELSKADHNGLCPRQQWLSVVRETEMNSLWGEPLKLPRTKASLRLSWFLKSLCKGRQKTKRKGKRNVQSPLFSFRIKQFGLNYPPFLPSLESI